MLRRRDPLRDPATLIPRVYAYVAYRIGHGPDAEDVTGDVFERALRYRDSYDPGKGEPATWLLGIARRCIADRHASARPLTDLDAADGSLSGPEEAVERRLTVAAAVAKLDERARELVALRYGADLTARQIGALMDMRPNAVEVALHRALAELRESLDERPPQEPAEKRKTLVDEPRT